MGFVVAAESRLTCSYMRAQLVLVPCLVSRAISLAAVSATYCVSELVLSEQRLFCTN
jgi:hypothetical protein